MNTTPLLLKRTVMAIIVAAAFGACSEGPAPEPVTPQPILQGNQLRFPAGHPQLALIGITTSTPGRAIAVDLPAKLVWHEERTQRIYPSFAGRISAIQADVGLTVKPGTVLAQLASPDFGVAQADNKADRNLVVLRVIEERAAIGVAAERPTRRVHDQSRLMVLGRDLRHEEDVVCVVRVGGVDVHGAEAVVAGVGPVVDERAPEQLEQVAGRCFVARHVMQCEVAEHAVSGGHAGLPG